MPLKLRGRWSGTTLALAGLCLLVCVIGLRNAMYYPPGLGYDAASHIAYADGLVPGGHLPTKAPADEYFNPPGYYALVGTVDWVAKGLGAADPHRAGIALNVLLLVGTVLLTWRIGRELWPDRELPALAAAFFVGLVPVTVKAAAMFHPETTSLFVCTLAVWLCLRTLALPRFAYALGVALGAAQLVRAFSLWVVAAVLLVLALSRHWRSLAIVAALAVAIPLPWYVHQTVVYGKPLAFNRSAPSTFVLARRPVSFYVDPGVPDVVVHPYRPHLANLAIPTTYAELWGDYFGIWAWNPANGPPSAHARHELELQSLLGLLPTLAAVVGLILLLRDARRDPRRLLPALLPVLGLLGFGFFAISYPSDDGDVLKATYMLTATAGWAVAFGYGLDRLRGRARAVAVAVLALCALAELPFLLW